MPTIYQQSFNAVDPTNSGETSVNSLSRVLSTSSLPAATVDKVCCGPLPSPCSSPCSPPFSVFPSSPSYNRYHRMWRYDSRSLIS